MLVYAIGLLAKQKNSHWLDIFEKNVSAFCPKHLFVEKGLESIYLKNLR